MAMSVLALMTDTRAHAVLWRYNRRKEAGCDARGAFERHILAHREPQPISHGQSSCLYARVRIFSRSSLLTVVNGSWIPKALASLTSVLISS